MKVIVCYRQTLVSAENHSVFSWGYEMIIFERTRNIAASVIFLGLKQCHA
ncbi:hypothetical protein RK21_02000 [Pseudomonas plecoglossicida]|nr:hypothetical protein RK21_02000 [Pseudomonas plecoglossicida]